MEQAKNGVPMYFSVDSGISVRIRLFQCKSRLLRRSKDFRLDPGLCCGTGGDIVVFQCGSLDFCANIGIYVWFLVFQCESWAFSVNPDIPAWILGFHR